MSNVTTYEVSIHDASNLTTTTIHTGAHMTSPSWWEHSEWILIPGIISLMLLGIMVWMTESENADRRGASIMGMFSLIGFTITSIFACAQAMTS